MANTFLSWGLGLPHHEQFPGKGGGWAAPALGKSQGAGTQTTWKHTAFRGQPASMAQYYIFKT